MATKTQEWNERLTKLQQKSESLASKAERMASNAAFGDPNPNNFYSSSSTTYKWADNTSGVTGGPYTTVPIPNTGSPTVSFPNVQQTPYSYVDPAPMIEIKEKIVALEEQLEIIGEKMDLLLEVIEWLQLKDLEKNA
jgi:hypothetical protein